VDTQFGGGVAKGDIVVVVEASDSGDGAADVVSMGGVVEVFDRWVFVVAAEDFFSFFFSTRKSGVI
jgi:hypothetical protein